MRLDKDYLTELELLPIFEWRGMARRAQGVLAAPQATRGASAAGMAGAAPARAVPTPIPPQAPVTTSPADPARALRINSLDWPRLAGDAANCQACGLCQQRQQVVVGVGATNAPWLFIGEAPGTEEDQGGEPFVGPSGKLLDAMLTAAGLQRGREVYITNVVKCRPPGNRTPTVDEAAACAPYLDRQIDLIKPKIIVALGKSAITRLTGTDAPMASLRGQLFRYRGIPVVATYHPSYLLHKLPEKLKAWEDLVFAKREFGKVVAPDT